MARIDTESPPPDSIISRSVASQRSSRIVSPSPPGTRGSARTPGRLRRGRAAPVGPGVWVHLVVAVPLFEEPRSSDVGVRAGAPSARGHPAGRPPIGGTGGLAGKLQAALRGQGSAV